MEGTSLALPAVGTLVARAASSGRRVPIQIPTPGTCASTAPTSTQRTTAIRRAVFRFVASPAKLFLAQTDNRINNLLHQFPFSLPYGGSVYRTTGGWDARSAYGAFWSEGAASGSNARYLSFYGAYVWPENGSYKTNGFPVRCIASQINRT